MSDAGSVITHGAEKGMSKTLWQKMSVGGNALNVGFEAFTGPMQERPAGIVGALGGAVTSGIISGTKLAGTMPAIAVEMGVYFGVKYGLVALERSNEEHNTKWRQMTRIGAGFNVPSMLPQSKTLLTQRQESLRAIQTSILNARSSIGNEAALMRRSIDEYL